MCSSDLIQAHANAALAASLMSVTGTVVVDLPKWGDTDFTYFSYNGTVFREPEVGDFFVNHVTDVRLVIGNIRTN